MGGADDRHSSLSPLAEPSSSATGEGFVAAAGQLAGMIGAALGWRPDEFWTATPAEVAAIFSALASPATKPAGAKCIQSLKERFPDG